MSAFDDILGHRAQIDLLLNQLAQDRLAHGLAFVGSAGIGKSLVANRMAAHLLSQVAGQESNWQAELSLIQSGAHPDFLLLEPDASTARGEIKVEAARKLVTFMQQTPTRSAWRVAIIDQANKLNTQAANGILKVLEEPPAKGLIILVLSDLAAVLPTIRSRLVPMRFNPLTQDQLADLAQRQGLSLDPASLAAAQGSIERLQALAEPETQFALKALGLIAKGNAKPADCFDLAKWAATNAGLARELVLEQISASARAHSSKALAQHYLTSLDELDNQARFNLDPVAAWLRVLTQYLSLTLKAMR